MDSISVRLFSTPTVNVNGKTLSFRTKKAEALFYYLLVKKQASRDQLVYLLWSEEEEETAKKNLRNALYNIRRAFNGDILLTPRKSIVMLNPEINIDCDLYHFLKGNKDSITAYTGEFLQGFYVKACQELEEWLQAAREDYKSSYTSMLYKRLEEAAKENKIEEIEPLSRLLIAVDPYDERAHKILLKGCIAVGAFNKGLEYYKRLAEILERELGIQPDNEAQALHRELLKQRSLLEAQSGQQSPDRLFGRNDELMRLRSHYNSFINGGDYKALFIFGEAGIGKTLLKEHFLSELGTQPLYIFQSSCYQAEESFYLRPWNSIFIKLAELINHGTIHIPSSWRSILAYISPVFAFEGVEAGGIIDRMEPIQYQLVEEVLLGLFKRLGEIKKVLIVFEDINWMDKTSLSLLNCIILHQESNGCLVVATCRDEYNERLDNTMAALHKHDLMERLELRRFHIAEVREYVTGALPKYKFTDEAIAYIYRETEGNSFFLAEYVNAVKGRRNRKEMSSTMQEVLKSRFLGLSQEARKLLNIISIFFDNISLALLTEILQKDELEIIRYMEELTNKRIIEERPEGEGIYYSFTHQKLREFIYHQQAAAMRRILHNKAGLLLEQQLKHEASDYWIYPRLIYHFSNGGNYIAALKYHIRNADLYLDYTHELFPVLVDNPRLKEKSLYLPKEQALAYIQEAEVLIKRIKSSKVQREELRPLELHYYLIKGRYHIKEGEYDSGVEVITRLIEASIAQQEDYYLLKAYRQMIYYSIQTHNVELIKEYVDKSFAIAREKGYQREFGFLLRLQGVSRIMMGEYSEAEELLKQALNIFMGLNRQEDKYASNIAAIYNYLGEIRRYSMRFSRALSYYDEAISICRQKGFLRGLTIFNTNAGRTAFEMGDYEGAKQYFRKALTQYNQYDIVWGRSVAEAYMALLLIGDGEYTEAHNCLKRAEELSRRLKSPYEIGLTYRIKADIKARMNDNRALNNFFKDYLSENIAVYCKNGIELLSRVKESYEVEILKLLQKRAVN